jgi:thioredoxin reductase (NADPH)
MTAAIYAVRYNLKTVLVSKDFGGQILNTGEIENWPGSKKITGPELAQNYEEHARSLGANLVSAFVENLKKIDGGFEAVTDSGDEYSKIIAKSVILTSGANHRHLGVKGESEFSGRGVSYCATCDGPFFRNKVTAVIGGGDAAIGGALDLANNASKVYLIHRRSDFRAKPGNLDKAKANPKIEFILDTNLTEIKGSTKVEGVTLDKPYNGSTELKLDGIFVEIGFVPENTLAKSLGVEITDTGYIKVAEDQSTNVDGLYAAGDVTTASNRFAQLVTAASEGAIAAEAVFKRLHHS